MLQNFNISQQERVSIIKNWLGRQGLQLLETLIQTKREACYDEEGLFEILNTMLRPQYNEKIKSLQFHSLARYYNESMKGWMGWLRREAMECNCKECR